MQQLLGKAQDKSFWAEVREKECYKPLIERLKKEYAENMATGDLLNLKYSEFKLFWVTGNRTIYEKQFNLRRARANHAALLALIYPEEQEYLDVLMDSVYAICDEYSWCLPAHHGQLEVNDNARIRHSVSADRRRAERIDRFFIFAYVLLGQSVFSTVFFYNEHRDGCYRGDGDHTARHADYHQGINAGLGYLKIGKIKGRVKIIGHEFHCLCNILKISGNDRILIFSGKIIKIHIYVFIPTRIVLVHLELAFRKNDLYTFCNNIMLYTIDICNDCMIGFRTYFICF